MFRYSYRGLQPSQQRAHAGHTQGGTRNPLPDSSRSFQIVSSFFGGFGLAPGSGCVAILVRQKINMRKIDIISVVILCIIAGGVIIAVKQADKFHTAERRQWKNDAITAITNDLKNPDYLKERFGEVPKPMGEFDTSEPKWLTEDTIVCRDAAWLAYRAETHKVNPKIHDIFIAKASDGNWYYSDFHFCKQMMVLGSNGQPASLAEFKHQYFLVEFDGASDAALKPSWIPAGELRNPDQRESGPGE